MMVVRKILYYSYIASILSCILYFAQLATAQQDFEYNGGTQTFTIPSNVYSLFIEVYGAAGGADFDLNTAGGRGGYVSAYCSFPAGTTFTIYVGGAGAGGREDENGANTAGYNGGGVGYGVCGAGGGGSDIRFDGTALSNRFIVAGGGGGNCNGPSEAGSGGGTEGESDGGGGATQSSGGSAESEYGYTAQSGSLGQGGDGITVSGGGGGGGYYGGGGSGPGGNGGGGSAWADSTYCTSIVYTTAGGETGDGYIQITTIYYPSSYPSASPSGYPTTAPSSQPSTVPSTEPTMQPSNQPSNMPSISPSTVPSSLPSSQPSIVPTRQPSTRPSGIPSGQPSMQPSGNPTMQPTIQPSGQPSCIPSRQPSSQPSGQPSSIPTAAPTHAPPNYDLYFQSIPAVFVCFGYLAATVLRSGFPNAKLNKLRHWSLYAMHVLLVMANWFFYLQSILYYKKIHFKLSETDFHESIVLCLLVLAKTPGLFGWLSFVLMTFAPRLLELLTLGYYKSSVPLHVFLYFPATTGKAFGLPVSTLYSAIIICCFYDLNMLKFLVWNRTSSTDQLSCLPNLPMVYVCLLSNAVGSFIQVIASLAVIKNLGRTEWNLIFLVFTFLYFTVSIFEILLVFTALHLPDRGILHLNQKQIDALMELEAINKANVSAQDRDSMVSWRRSSIAAAVSSYDHSDDRTLDKSADEEDNKQSNDSNRDEEEEQDDNGLFVKTADPEAEDIEVETIRLLKGVLQDAGLPAPVYIYLPKLKKELNALVKKMNRGKDIDLARFDYLIMCLNYHPEYKRELQREMLKWQKSVRPFLAECYSIMQAFIPPDVFTTRFPLRDFLQQSGLPRALAQRIATKRCLWIVRMEIAYLEKLHEAELLGSYNPLGQQLDVVELSAIVHALPSQFKRDPSGKKKKWHESVLDSLKKMLVKKEAGQLNKTQLRHPAYSGLVANGGRGPFADRDSLFLPGITAVQQQQHELDSSSHDGSYMRRAEEGGMSIDSLSMGGISVDAGKSVAGRSSFMIEQQSPSRDRSRHSFRSMSNGNSVKSLIKAMNTRNDNLTTPSEEDNSSRRQRQSSTSSSQRPSFANARRSVLVMLDFIYGNNRSTESENSIADDGGFSSANNPIRANNRNMPSTTVNPMAAASAPPANRQSFAKAANRTSNSLGKESIAAAETKASNFDNEL